MPRAATQPTDPPALPELNRVLAVVRRLIDYGRQLADTIRQRAAAPGFARFAKPFGTADLAVILARIANGLRRAVALEARLCQRAARGKDLTVAPIRLPRLPAIREPSPPRLPVPADTPPGHPSLARLPTGEEIAAEVRRRPVGAIIVDICVDLGIAPGNLDRAFWDELCHAIIAYGGSLAGFLGGLNRRLFAVRLADHPDGAAPLWPAAPPRLPAPAIGPP